MVFRSHIYLATLLIIIVMAHQTVSAPYLDPIDECILICDACFKGDPLLNCANDCLMQTGDVHQRWKSHCPLFDAQRMPSVQMI